MAVQCGPQLSVYGPHQFFAGPPTGAGGPEASLLIGAQSELFGTTAGGGASNYGTIFALMPVNETLLYTFGGPDGAYPNASLVANGAEGFYGTTAAGGAGGGTLFQLLPPTAPGVPGRKPSYMTSTQATRVPTVHRTERCLAPTAPSTQPDLIMRRTPLGPPRSPAAP
jgi:uncharacterized repeat protein (TIGR03803 family)